MNFLLREFFLTVLLIFTLLACSSPAEPSEKADTESVALSATPPDVVAGRYNVAFLIMDGVYNTELTAPYDIFQHTIFRDSIKAMNTFLVANTLAPITTFEGIQ